MKKLLLILCLIIPLLTLSQANTSIYKFKITEVTNKYTSDSTIELLSGIFETEVSFNEVTYYFEFKSTQNINQNQISDKLSNIGLTVTNFVKINKNTQQLQSE